MSPFEAMIGAVAWICLVARGTIVSAASTLRRLRYRSGDYPESVPPGCDLRLHAPLLVAPHPLQSKATVEAHLAPVYLAAVVGSLGDGSVLELGLDAPNLYLADHARYSRGGGMWAWRGLAEASGAEADKWVLRLLDLATSIATLVSGGPVDEIAEPPWVWDPDEWEDAYANGWHQSIFTALGIFAELVCHRALRDPAEDVLPPSAICASSPSEDMDTCAPTTAMNNLKWAEFVDLAEYPDLSVADVARLTVFFMRGCDAMTAFGSAALGVIWRHFSVFDIMARRQDTSGVMANRIDRGVCSATVASYRNEVSPQLLCADLCANHVSSSLANGTAVAHVLGASVSVAQEGLDVACVVVEISLFVSPGDDCYVTQAGSTMRSSPSTFMVPWECRVPAAASSGSQRPLTAKASVVSHFGVDTVFRCFFAAPDFAARTSESEVLSVELASPLGEVAGIRLCAGRCGLPVGAAPVPTDLAPPPSRRLTVCSGIFYDTGLVAREGELPLLVQWMEYHLAVGVDHFFIYDTDGSAAPLLAPYEHRGEVTYFPRWPASLSEKSASVVRDCKSCLNMHMNAHCVSRNRGLSRWVLLLHGFDTYLASGRPAGSSRDLWSGSRSSATLLRSALGVLDLRWEQLGTVALSMVDFGGPPTNSSWVIGRFLLRQVGPISATHELAKGASRDVSWLNHFGAVMVNPLNILGTLDHWSRSRPGATDVEVPWEIMRVNHYIDAVRPRCQEHHIKCDRLDFGILENLRHICVKLGFPIGGAAEDVDDRPAC